MGFRSYKGFESRRFIFFEDLRMEVCRSFVVRVRSFLASICGVFVWFFWFGLVCCCFWEFTRFWSFEVVDMVEIEVIAGLGKLMRLVVWRFGKEGRWGVSYYFVVLFSGGVVVS